MIQHHEWSYGITTCPERIENGLLDQTKQSLAKTGFTNPTIFVDGPIGPWEFENTPNPASYRSANLRPFGNWMLAAWELWLRNPLAQRYAIFQDDVIAVYGLMNYLSTCEYPYDGYLNLYTFPENQKGMSLKLGWYPAEGGQGLGALGLVFDNEAMSKLLRDPHLIMRCKNSHRGHKLIDGAVNEAMKNAGYKEYVHNPSLLQHAGQFKSTFPEKKNKSHQLAPSFPGENVDINEFTEKLKVVAGKRIGFVGRHCGDDISLRNVKFCKHVDVDRWMIIPHPSKNIKYPLPDWLDMTACRNSTDRKMKEFVRSIDILVFMDDDFKYQNLLRISKEQGRTVIGICDTTTSITVRPANEAEQSTKWLAANKIAFDMLLGAGLNPISFVLPENKEQGDEITAFIRNLAISS